MYSAEFTGIGSKAFSFSNVAAGEYALKVLKKGHITEAYTFTVTNAPVVQNTELWLIGDINRDGYVDALDCMMAELAQNGHLPSETVLLPYYDIDCNGVFEIADFQLIMNISVGICRAEGSTVES